ncbi:bifunctional phosphoribosylaminoimidazolecarboxamide formyltransferase/IMP cyclohydrolase [uncultured Peptoniphilus sp.]|uniref:bifunctional phosphoribosylaminoimidazolecarboxamide formyltransferase/IMP cyclohydrolase n=1 Tax=uncultured Peptoniphilus sp. TaxID=254354 RepID=UPI002805DB9F|nr:bifunctional phosphoribosylaminoimidazolecarboxamide formyltransferase/IMP cyclohydrolase [uncultured Peptoniphilus sp.]
MRALISVYDKEGIVEFANNLIGLGWEIISTGGSYKTLCQNKVPCKEVQEITGQREIFGGRVKTLHPKIHGGILYRRDEEEDQKILQEEKILPIDMVVNNLYPFEMCLNEGKSHDELIEKIDIGGPAMIRAAAKNYRDVFIVTDPSDYNKIIDALKNNKADIKFREALAAKAFKITSHYDTLISTYFSSLENSSLNTDDEFLKTINHTYELENILRYGENPHQRAAFYRGEEIAAYKKLHGKEISYNNLYDMFAAVKAVKEFEVPAVVAVKHTNPCGIGIGKDVKEAFIKARDCDDESIFGGIIAINRKVTEDLAKLLYEIFLEIVVAPTFSKEALEILEGKKNIRLIEMPNLNDFKIKYSAKEVLNGIILQEYDNILWDEKNLKFVSKRKPTEEELKELKFAFECVKYTASNSVVIAKDGGTLGIGQGQTKRSWAVEEAIERAGEKIKGAVLASDGFFFVDTMELLYKAGVKVIIQPGGSVKDKDVIEYADEHNMTLVFTGLRHFRH